MGLARRVRVERDYRRQRIELTAQGRKMHAQLVQVQVASGRMRTEPKAQGLDAVVRRGRPVARLVRARTYHQRRIEARLRRSPKLVVSEPDSGHPMNSRSIS
jgi:DNA-binding MarR family transcriptional regulator